MFWALVQVAGAQPEAQAVQAVQLLQEQEQSGIKLSDYLELRDT